MHDIHLRRLGSKLSNYPYSRSTVVVNEMCVISTNSFWGGKCGYRYVGLVVTIGSEKLRDERLVKLLVTTMVN
jgi:hypothetical protein